MMHFMQNLLLGALLLPTMAATQQLRSLMYLTDQHKTFPQDAKTAPLTHVYLAFMQSETFNRELGSHDWQKLWLTVEETRAQFRNGTAVLISIGGWGNTKGYSEAMSSEENMKRFAANVASMVSDLGADGIDVDCEYPGGNGEDYKNVTNYDKAGEVQAYPKLLAEIRAALGPDKIITAAVPGRVGDMIAFTEDTVPLIMEQVDFLNVMAYDMVNRRNSVSGHHTGVKLSLEAINAYIVRGAKPEALNLGFAFYTRWFKTRHEGCVTNSLNCPLQLGEDPITGGDLGEAGELAWADPVPDEFKASFSKAQTMGSYDPNDGSYYYWDEAADLFWSFDTAENIRSKFNTIVAPTKVGGVFAWELGSDGPDFSRWEAYNQGIEACMK